MAFDNAWSGSEADRRLFRATFPSLTVASAAAAADPWLAAVAAGTAIASDDGATIIHFQMIVRDGFSQPALSDVVEIITGIGTAAYRVNSRTITAGTQVGIVESAAAMGAGNTGVHLLMLPDATGLVDVTLTFNATGAKLFAIRHRHIVRSGTVTIA